MFADDALIDPERRRSRIIAAVTAVTLQALVGAGLILGLAGRLPVPRVESLTLFAVPPEAVPPPVETLRPQVVRSRRKAGRAAPPALKARAAAIVAPPVVVPPAVPPPVVAAVVAGPGAADHAGAAPDPGPGSGLAGEGTGTGSGSDGDGMGDGGVESRYRSGRIRDGEFPAAASEVGVKRTVGLRYVVGPSGRIVECVVTRPSGNAVFDAAICPLLQRHLRYWPARDASGRKISDVWVGEHTIENRGDPAPPGG